MASSSSSFSQENFPGEKNLEAASQLKLNGTLSLLITNIRVAFLNADKTKSK